MTSVLKFWGTRGSIPTPGPQTARYGGNTACLSLTGPGQRLVILDAGSGLRPLGHELMASRPTELTADTVRRIGIEPFKERVYGNAHQKSSPRRRQLAAA